MFNPLYKYCFLVRIQKKEGNKISNDTISTLEDILLKGVFKIQLICGP